MLPENAPFRGPQITFCNLPPPPPGAAPPSIKRQQCIQLLLCPRGSGGRTALGRNRMIPENQIPGNQRLNRHWCPLLPRPRQLGSTRGKSRIPLQGFLAKDSVPAPSLSRMGKALASHCPPRPPTCAPLPTGSVQKSPHKSQICV